HGVPGAVDHIVSVLVLKIDAELPVFIIKGVVPAAKEHRIGISDLYLVQLIDNPVDVDIVVNHVAPLELVSGTGSVPQVFRRKSVGLIDDVPVQIAKDRVGVGGIYAQRPVPVESADHIARTQFGGKDVARCANGFRDEVFGQAEELVPVAGNVEEGLPPESVLPSLQDNRRDPEFN